MKNLIFRLQKNYSQEQGFTLVEIIVATAIFITTVAAVLVLFNFVLRINREVQVTRQATQGVRNFTEILAREIRNGRIYYGNSGVDCNPLNYSFKQNQTLALITPEGEELCLSLRGTDLNIQKTTPSGSIEEVINPTGLTVEPDSFYFVVRPQTDPESRLGGYPGIQPMVTILAKFNFTQGNESITIPYQTSISTDVYDIPNK